MRRNFLIADERRETPMKTLFCFIRVHLRSSAVPLFLLWAPAAQAQFVGSAACAECHGEIYARWKGTLMANIFVDVKQHPEAILADFSKPSPLVKFKKEEIAFTYGSKWKQRYFTKIGDDFFVFPAQWDVRNKAWRPYYVQPGTDWWVAHYPADQMKRPTGPLCDGCHSVNYDIKTKQVTEWNVGCEKCHGPGGEHSSTEKREAIVNPARLDTERAADVCIQCHSQGQPRSNPIQGVYYDWPVGYQPGARLADSWKLEQPELGHASFTHWPEGSAHKNRMQGNDYVASVMYAKGVRCSGCHDVHGTSHAADTIKPGNALCLTCHGPDAPAGPRGTLEQHTHHKAGSTGSLCVSCHMPRIAQTIATVSVRSHTFRFIPPSMTEKYKIPNPCTDCHVGRSTQWASGELRKWENFSSWRVAP
jgi:predicted CXXCH cytochrome family protein